MASRTKTTSSTPVREVELSVRDVKPFTVVALSAWLCSVIGLLITAPDYERYHSRVERMERLLSSHCSEWALTKDANYIPTHELLANKCLPK